MLILCPTRELAVQVCEEINRLASALKGLRPGARLWWRTNRPPDARPAQRCPCRRRGTPGRVMDHLRRKTLRTDAISLCILDEADRMLDMGFREDMEIILGDMPENRQTLFSFRYNEPRRRGPHP